RSGLTLELAAISGERPLGRCWLRNGRTMGDLTVGLLGMGTVGTGVARLLIEHRDRLGRRAGRPIRLKWVAGRDPARPRGGRLDDARVTTEARLVVEDPDVDVVIETIGGTDPALALTLSALEAGKDVVTANKAMLAERGDRVFAQARATGRAVAFEASVGG